MQFLVLSDVKGGIKKNLIDTKIWKQFICEEKKDLKDMLLISIDITTIQQEGKKIYFDVSIIYSLVNGTQKQGYESGLVILDKNNNIKVITPLFEN